MKHIRHLIRKLKYKFKFFSKNKNTKLNYVVNATSNSELTDLMNLYGSDKGGKNNHHNYSEYYSQIFYNKKNKIKNFLEIGLGTNNTELASNMGENGKPLASLRAWRDYFPNASIIGCDIDTGILFRDERIKTFHCDQTSSKSIKKFLENAELVEGSTDIIIDDGLHEFYAGICFFENMIGSLCDNGIYIIEDVAQSDVVKYKDYFSKLSDAFEAQFVYLKSPLREFGDDNNLVCVRRKPTL